MNKKNKKTKGFTLIEIVVILFIASVGIISSLSLAVRSAYFQNVKRDVISTIFLSAEGLELMKNVRDTNIILGRKYDDWTGEGSVGLGTNLYKVDYYQLTPEIISSIDDAVLQQKSTGFYLHDLEEENSIFKRLITVTADDSDKSKIESWVSWENGGNTYHYKLETVLYDLSF